MSVNNLKLRKLYFILPPFMRKWATDIYFRQSIGDAFGRFLTVEEKSDSKLKKTLKKDIYQCRKEYGIEVNEYFLYDFRHINPQQRSTFLTRTMKDQTMDRIVGFEVFNREVRDKYNFYLLLKDYFGREVCLVSKNREESVSVRQFVEFATRHPDLFVKNNALSKGRGVALYHVENKEEAEKLFHRLYNSGDTWVIEEKIVQDPSIAVWNESSVNTVRLPAILNNDKFTVLGPCLRMGRAGAIVDNASSGGIFACVDVETGCLCSDGFDDKYGKYFDKHPDSGITFKGWQVPRWKELLETAEKIHRLIPHHKYIGWDFALTEKGWVVVEGNWGQLLSQYNDHIGLKKQFFELLGVTISYS